MSGPFPRTDWIWRDGSFIPWEDASLHVMAHVIHYGSSVFEGIRCYDTPTGPAAFRLRDHMRRLLDSARIYRMDPGHSVGALEAASLELVARNGLRACYLRPLIVRGVGAAGLDPASSPVHTYLICWPWGAYLGAGALEEGVDVCVSSWRRPTPGTFPTQSKAGGHYLNAQLMKMEAVAGGFSEAIALTTGGLVSEGSGQNLFLVRDGTLLTPQVDGSMLAGITRDSVLTLARDAGIPIRHENVPRETLHSVDELFFTGTAAEVTPIRSVDRIPVGDGRPGPMTRALQDALLGVASGRRPDPHGWLTPVPSLSEATSFAAATTSPASPEPHRSEST